MSGRDLEPMAELAGTIAHDFNNLVAAMKGYAELAQQGVPEGDQAWGDLEQLLRAADRAENLARQLQEFSRTVLADGRTGRPEALGTTEPMLQRLLAEAGLQQA